MFVILKSEWIKFRTYTWCIVGALGALLLPPMLFLLGALSQGGSVQYIPIDDFFFLYLKGLFIGQVSIIVAAAGLWGQEYSNSSLRTTLLAVPSRLKWLGAKILVLTTIVFVVGICSSLLCLAVAILQFKLNITSTFLLEFIQRTLPILLSWIQISWIAASISVITKSLVTPIAILFSLMLGLSQLLFLIFPISKYLPDMATTNLFLLQHVPNFLTVNQGLVTQFCWGLLLTIAAIYLSLRHDVR